MKITVLSFIFFGMICLGQIYAQDSTEYSFEQIQDNIAEIVNQSGEEINLDELTDYLYQLTSKPVKINSMDEQDMKRIFWLTDFQISNLTRYLKINGPMHTVYELSYVEGFSERDAKLLVPFIRFDLMDDKEGKHNYFRYPTQTLILRTHKILEKQAGFKDENSSKFLGNPYYFYSRYQLHNENVSVGITGEKDSGEEFFSGSNSGGFDFYSFHIMVSNLGLLKTLIVGDYKLNFGNGLITGSAFNLGKTPSVLSSAYQNSGITKFTATDENNYFRGVACTFVRGKTEWSLFYSRHKMDANVSIRDTVDNKVTEVTTLQSSGLHTTPSEISDEDAVQNKVLGTHLKYRNSNAEFGLTALYNEFSANINPDYELYNMDYFRGSNNYNLGVNYRVRTGNVLWFGEEAYSKSKRFAFLNGVQAHPYSGMLLNIIYRNYEDKYQALFGNAFGENSHNQNEKGLYFGLQCSLVKFISFMGYADFFHFPKPRYGVDMPSEGQEYMGQFTFTPNSFFQMYVQYRIKQKQENEILAESPKNILVMASTKHLRLGLSYKVTSSLTLKNRFEYSGYSKGQSSSSEGFLISQDIDYKFSNIPIWLYSRYAVFDTDDYDSRIYAYESDILYTFSIPSFSNKGFRFCFMVKISPLNKIDIWAKYALTQYADKETISSGLYEINGNTKSDIKMQILFHF